MSEKKIKWGFIGCGEVTKYKSGPAFQKVEGSEVIAVMSRDGAKAKAYAKERGIPKWYDDAQELIDDEDVNAIYIATPPSSHATYAIMAMKAGKPVYIEKPMAVTYEECCRINRISNETGGSLLCSLLPSLSALLPQSKRIDREWKHRQRHQCSNSFCPTSP